METSTVSKQACDLRPAPAAFGPLSLQQEVFFRAGAGPFALRRSS